MRRNTLIITLGLWGWLSTSGAIASDEGVEAPKVVKVEETWELKVGEPNLERNAPQVTMVMAPFGDVDGRHFIFLLNHRSHPDYVAGGLQVQRWYGEQLRTYQSAPQTGELVNEDETIQWTQTLSLDAENNRVIFEVDGGTSQSWGDFGGNESLRLTGSHHYDDHLNGYTPYVSITESGIDYAGNRVVSLTLLSVRWTMSDGQVYQMSAPIDIDSDLDPWDGQ